MDHSETYDRVLAEERAAEVSGKFRNASLRAAVEMYDSPLNAELIGYQQATIESLKQTFKAVDVSTSKLNKNIFIPKIKCIPFGSAEDRFSGNLEGQKSTLATKLTETKDGKIELTISVDSTILSHGKVNEVALKAIALPKEASIQFCQGIRGSQTGICITANTMRDLIRVVDALGDKARTVNGSAMPRDLYRIKQSEIDPSAKYRA